MNSSTKVPKVSIMMRDSHFLQNSKWNLQYKHKLQQELRIAKLMYVGAHVIQCRYEDGNKLYVCLHTGAEWLLELHFAGWRDPSTSGRRRYYPLRTLQVLYAVSQINAIGNVWNRHGTRPISIDKTFGLVWYTRCNWFLTPEVGCSIFDSSKDCFIFQTFITIDYIQVHALLCWRFYPCHVALWHRCFTCLCLTKATFATRPSLVRCHVSAFNCRLSCCCSWLCQNTRSLAAWYWVPLALKQWPASCNLRFVTSVDGLGIPP